MQSGCQAKMVRRFKNQLCGIKWFYFFATFAVANILLGIFLILESWSIATMPPVSMEYQQGTSLYSRSQFVYLDVKNVSDWTYDYAPSNSRMRQTASYFFEVIDTENRRFIVQILKSYAARNPDIWESLKCTDFMAPYRIYGCVKPISNNVVDGILEANHFLQSRVDYRKVYGYTILQIQDRPSLDITFPLVIVILWLIATGGLYWQMTKGFHAAIQKAKRNREIEDVLADWKFADKEYQGRGFYLGKNYIYCRNGGTFFKYTDISDVERGADRQYRRRSTDTQWPSLLVVKLKNGRKILVGTNDKPSADRELREIVVERIKNKMGS